LAWYPGAKELKVIVIGNNDESNADTGEDINNDIQNDEPDTGDES